MGSFLDALRTSKRPAAAPVNDFGLPTPVRERGEAKRGRFGPYKQMQDLSGDIAGQRL